ncbi:MAG: DUF4430 domain-containing protein [Roseburia sp.]|nr:DUF4430 domain-containing protein [Roseburia sp.]MCM1242555.1 DUF4430 domain-containing protein [Roseburia sp.]
METKYKKNIIKNKKRLSYALCVMLLIAIVLFTNACGNGTDSSQSSDMPQENAAQTTQTADASQAEDTSSAEDSTQLGEGSSEFAFTVVDKDGNETAFTIHTDKETVGEALLELGLIVGDESEYGLYVKTVNGITADYDTDGTYWAFYINGEYAQTGVDSTAVTAGADYTFKVE